MWGPWLAVLLLAVIFALTWLKIRWSGRHLRALASEIPGPPTIPLIGNANLALFNGDKFITMARVLVSIHKYKPFRIWVGPKLYVFITKPDDVQIFLAKNGGRNFENTIAKYLGSELIKSSEMQWKKQQNIIDRTFETIVPERYLNEINNHSETLITNLRIHADGLPFDPYPVMALCTLDAICESILGVKINGQNNAQTMFIKHVLESLFLINERSVRPLMFLDSLYALTPSGRQQRISGKGFRHFVDEVVISRMKNFNEKGTEARSILDLLIRVSSEENDLLPEKITDEVCTMIAAGQNTTPNSLCFVLCLLGLYPKLQEQIVQELRNIFKDDWRRPVTSQDVKEMDRLDKFIKETLRLFPAVSYIPRDLEEDLKLSCCTLPAGCKASVLPYFTHRDPQHYPDPERFDPDRPRGSHSSCYFPYGADQRSLVGSEFTEFLMKTILATILRRYEVFAAVTYDSLKDLRMGLILQPTNGFKIKIEPR